MYLFDISQNIFDCNVYDGDPKPTANSLKDINYGETYNLSSFEMCTHNGTHIDAPSHYINGGMTIDEIPLSKFYGACTVVEISGLLTGRDMEKILPKCKKKVIFKGQGELQFTLSAINVMVDFELDLIGIDDIALTLEEKESEVHRKLLQNDIIILEGLNLENIVQGHYKLCAFPIKLDGLEAAPVRAILLKEKLGI